MRESNGIKTFIPVCLLATVLAVCLTASARAESAVLVTKGIVVVDADSETVSVIVRLDERMVTLIPSNGQGLYQGGQIADGDVVDVQIVQDKKHRHRGHVTVLK